MPKPKILFDASPMMDVKKSGVGYYVGHLFSSLGEHYGNKLQLTGYYFDFLGHGHKAPPTLKGATFQKIWLMPGKLLSVCRRLGFQPFLELFTQRNADIVLFTNYVSLPMIRKKRSALVIYDLSFLDHPEYMQTINLEYLKRFCAPSIRRADLIITISEFTKQRLLHHFPDLKAPIIITPIPPVETDTTPVPLDERLTDLGIQAQKYLLFVSTLEPRKNVQNLIKAYVTLPKQIRNEYALVLAGGKGWKDEEIHEDIKTQQDAGANIILTGYISETEKKALYSQASLFVMPSHYEGFGMPILEAMQYGIPVACSDIPIFREVAGNAAEYFDKDDATSISNTLHNVLTNGSRRKRLKQASAEQLDKFSWEDIAKNVYTALRKLA
jgi:glycosyltransferase involved in cell wall biosynthesis